MRPGAAALREPDLSSRAGVRGALAATALLLAAAVLLFLKQPDMLLWPPLHAEDGTEMLAFYYCPRGPSSVLRDYNGYISLVPNLIGYLSLRAPITWAPTLLALAPFALSAACCLLPFALRLYGGALGTRAHLAAALLLAALPLGTASLVANTTYSLWNGLLALALLSLAPPAAGRLGEALRFAASALLLWTHPLSVVVLPLLAASLVREARAGRRRALLTGALIAIGLAYQIEGVAHAELADRPPPATLLRLALGYLTQRVVFGALFGSEARVALHDGGLDWAVTALGAALGVGVVLLGGRAVRAPGPARWPVLGLGYLVVAFTFAAVVGRVPQGRWLGSFFGERYFYVPKLLFWLLLVALVTPLLDRAGRRGRAGAVAALCLYAAAMGWIERQRYAVAGEDGRRIAAFVEEVARLEERHGGRRGIDAVLVRERGAPIHLRAPAENLPCPP